MRLIASALIAIIVTSSALCSEPYTDGGDGYYYDQGGARYTRSIKWEWVPGYYYWSRCCRYWKDGYWKNVGYTYKAVPLSAKYPDWKTQLLRIAAQKEENRAFIEAVREMGLTVPGNYADHASIAGLPSATQYSVFRSSSSADLYGLADPMVLFQQSSAHVRQAGELFGAGAQQYNQMVDKDRERAAFVSEIRAKGETAAQLLAALQPTPSTHIRNSQQSIIPTTPQRAAAIKACINCHGDKDPKGGYSVLRHWQLSAEAQMKVVAEHLLAEDGTEPFMPRDGERLPADLIKEFLPPGQRAKLR